jgi:hypothetical protein
MTTTPAGSPIILEHQAFFKRECTRLFSDDKGEIKRGLTFLEDLKKFGKSKLADQLLNCIWKGTKKRFVLFSVNELAAL